MIDNPWIRLNRPNPNARLRLFCFPYAGGAASIYRAWHQYLPPDIELCAVQLPGRENRIREVPYTAVRDLIDALIPHLLPYLDKPYALFGHSMGTIIAYELAQQLTQLHDRIPTQLLVSGRRAPTLPDPQAPLHRLTDDKIFLNELQRRYNNIPDLIFQDAELRELFVPLLRADFTLVERYHCISKTPLPCPIIVFGGDTDPHTSHTELAAWQTLTARDFDLHFLPGGHFYLNEQIEPLLATIVSHLGGGPSQRSDYRDSDNLSG